jgi:hypothetical protein
LGNKGASELSLVVCVPVGVKLIILFTCNV